MRWTLTAVAEPEAPLEEEMMRQSAATVTVAANVTFAGIAVAPSAFTTSSHRTHLRRVSTAFAA